MTRTLYEAHGHGQDVSMTRKEIICGLLAALEYLAKECRRNDLPEAAHFTGAAAGVCKEALETPNQAIAYSQPG